MVPVAGRPLIEHAVERFRAASIRSLSIVINETSHDCRQWLEHHIVTISDLDLVVRNPLPRTLSSGFLLMGWPARRQW